MIKSVKTQERKKTIEFIKDGVVIMSKKEVKYKRMTQEEKELMYKLFEEKMELRKIARALGRSLSTVQYHLKKTQRI